MAKEILPGDYICPNSRKRYSQEYFQRDQFCHCCQVANRLIPDQASEPSWVDYADVAD